MVFGQPFLLRNSCHSLTLVRTRIRGSANKSTFGSYSYSHKMWIFYQPHFNWSHIVEIQTAVGLMSQTENVNCLEWAQWHNSGLPLVLFKIGVLWLVVLGFSKSLNNGINNWRHILCDCFSLCPISKHRTDWLIKIKSTLITDNDQK